MALMRWNFWTSPGHPGQVALAVARGESTTRNLTFCRAFQAGLSYRVKLLRSTVGTSEPKLLGIYPKVALNPVYVQYSWMPLKTISSAQAYEVWYPILHGVVPEMIRL